MIPILQNGDVYKGQTYILTGNSWFTENNCKLRFLTRAPRPCSFRGGINFLLTQHLETKEAKIFQRSKYNGFILPNPVPCVNIQMKAQ